MLTISYSSFHQLQAYKHAGSIKFKDIKSKDFFDITHSDFDEILLFYIFMLHLFQILYFWNADFPYLRLDLSENSIS
eukprot:snap_masked-scaffold_27-processed-gene-1.48-mRNA-1 protein AED:1.00 eAED:1.00 QI:0/0/0/0/1/1/2/0/76